MGKSTSRIIPVLTAMTVGAAMACGSSIDAAPPGPPTAERARTSPSAMAPTGTTGAPTRSGADAGGTDIPDSGPDGSPPDVRPGAPIVGKHVIVDTDADNEADDQHAIAMVIMNSDLWTVDGITTNHTQRGGHTDNTVADDTREAERVVKMLGADAKVKVYTGVGGHNVGAQVDQSVSFSVLKDTLSNPRFEGKAAVDFIVQSAQGHTETNKLVLLAIGKLTNVALALTKDPTIVPKTRVLWLGSNYPDTEDEHNARHDYSAVNALMDSDVEFDIATVRYNGNPAGGTAAAIASRSDLVAHMSGAGPHVSPSVPGRDNLGMFTCFGDYSVALVPGDRPLYDLAGVSLEKDRSWARAVERPAPILVDTGSTTWAWKDRPNNARKVRFYEEFQGDKIYADFFTVMQRTQVSALK